MLNMNIKKILKFQKFQYFEIFVAIFGSFLDLQDFFKIEG